MFPPSYRPDARSIALHAQRTAAAGLGVAALLLPLATATAVTPGSSNIQVALANGTNQQFESSSDINGTARVLTKDGRFVVFSTAAALTPGDTNGLDDVYLRDTVDQITLLVSERHGQPGNSDSFEPTISGDGRFVAFTTTATNLTKDTNGDHLDVVVKDTYTGRLRTVSVTSTGKQKPFNSFSPVISSDGASVAFQTFAPLGSRDRDKREDVYVRDLRSGTTRQASLLPGRSKDVGVSVLNGDISDDGTKVAFGDSNRIWVRDLASRSTTLVWKEGDAPPCQDLPAGSAGRPVLSGNGRYVAFSSCAKDLPGKSHRFTNVYRFALGSAKVTMVTRGNGHSYLPSLSRSGRYVGFGSDAANLVAGDDHGPDAFVADIRRGTVVRASEAPDGSRGNNWSATTAASVSSDGHSLAYSSYADNLVAGDSFDLREVFLWRR